MAQRIATKRYGIRGVATDTHAEKGTDAHRCAPNAEKKFVLVLISSSRECLFLQAPRKDGMTKSAYPSLLHRIRTKKLFFRRNVRESSKTEQKSEKARTQNPLRD